MRNREFRDMRREWRRERRKGCNGRGGNVWAGMLLLVIGGALLARQLGYLLPDWLFTWPMLLIVIGLFVGARNGFRDFGWLIMVAVGSYFLMDEWAPDFPLHHYFWPVLIIGAGLLLLMRRRHGQDTDWHDNYINGEDQEKTGEQGEAKETGSGAATAAATATERIDVVSVFSNVRKLIYSKDFRGGDVVCIFGGAEINLLHADIQKPIVLDMVQIFGGAKLIIPADWQVRSEAVVFFGGIEDKRPQQSSFNPDKVIILKGTTLFGGLEIKSY